MAYPISDVPRRIVYSGSAGVGPYAFTFEVLANTDIAVYKNTTLLTLTTDYTVTINTGTGTGTVTLLVAATASDTVTIVGDRAIQRTSDFVTGGDLFANTLNEELDAQTIYTQQVDEKADRAIRAPVTDPTTINMVLPSKADRANSFLTFDSNGNPSATAVGAPGTPSAITRQVFSGNGSATVFTLASAPGAVGNSLQVYIGGIYQQRSTYTISGSTLTFSAAPVAGTDNIEVLNFSVTAVGETDSSLVNYIPAGAGALTRSVQSKLRDVVSVKDFGAVGDGVTDDTVAIQAAIAAAKNLYFPPGTYLVDTVAINGKGYVLTGSGTATTTLKAKAASTKLLQIVGVSTWATENVVKNMSLDISLMSDVATNVAIYHSYSWGCLFENILISGVGVNKLSYFADLPGTGNGVYTSTFTNVNFESTVGKVKLLGVSTGDAITTLLFNNCAFGQFDANNVMDIMLVMPVVQGNLNKFLLANTLGFSVIGGDIEGTGTCYVFGASVDHLMSLNNEFASFSGTYTSGTVVSCIMQDFGRNFLIKKNDQGMTFNDIPITFTNDTVNFTDAPVTYTKTGASFFRTQFNASNASAQQVDLQLTSAVGSAYIGQTSGGKAFVDSRGSGGVALQISGTDKVGVDTSDRFVISTATKTTVGAAGGASALPATPSGYLRIMRGATEFVIPYYAA